MTYDDAIQALARVILSDAREVMTQQDPKATEEEISNYAKDLLESLPIEDSLYQAIVDLSK